MHASDLECFGWISITTGFLGGAALGLGFHRERFLGGYAALPRRLLRLAHIACIAIGLLAIEFARSRFAASGSCAAVVAAFAFLVGGISMPLACLAVAWRASLRLVFALPVVALTTAAVLTSIGALS